MDRADRLEPRLNQAFMEYAQERGFGVDPARIRSPQDKPRVERNVAYAQSSYFAGERFIDLADAQRRAELWCRHEAGMRIHGTTQRRPLEVFDAEELPALRPPPSARYDLPHYARPKVHRDHHIEVAKALYSVPGNLIGSRVDARADRGLVKVFHRDALVKVHPRQAPGGRSTDPADLPQEKTAYALRDVSRLCAQAAAHGPSVGAYAKALVDHPLPWTKMRSIYALLGLVKRWGAKKVDDACATALVAEAVNVGLIGRMLERATEQGTGAPTPPRPPKRARFARATEEFATKTRRSSTAVDGPNDGHNNGASR